MKREEEHMLALIRMTDAGLNKGVKNHNVKVTEYGFEECFDVLNSFCFRINEMVNDKGCGEEAFNHTIEDYVKQMQEEAFNRFMKNANKKTLKEYIITKLFGCIGEFNILIGFSGFKLEDLKKHLKSENSFNWMKIGE